VPGFTTHTYICYRALQETLSDSDSYGPFARIASSHALALSHAKSNDPKGLTDDAEAVLAGCAYIGACGPDLFYIEYSKEGEFVADLLHYNRTGPFIVRWLTDLRQRVRSLKSGLAPPLERQLAYCLGHISHIAADITIHPYVNSIVGAYPENGKNFENARGILTENKWKFHNILEHYQDAYILHHRFIDQEGLGPDEACVNLGAPAGHWLRRQTDRTEWLGFVARTRSFYRYATNLDIEKYKYDFFANENTFVNVSGYYSDVIPDRATAAGVPVLTQGQTASGAGLFDEYVEDAVALTKQMWREVKAYLDIPAALQPDCPEPHRLSSRELKAFPLLGQHWNLDCGMAPRVTGGGRSDSFATAPQRSLAVAGGLELFTAASHSREDFMLPAAASSMRKQAPTKSRL
jgi:hypothetical protein